MWRKIKAGQHCIDLTNGTTVLLPLQVDFELQESKGKRRCLKGICQTISKHFRVEHKNGIISVTSKNNIHLKKRAMNIGLKLQRQKILLAIQSC